MRFPNVGIVIQGPLFSKGRTAKTRDLPVEKVTERDVVEFDCTQLVAETIEQAEKDFGAVVCVTWDTEDTERLISLVGAAAVHAIRDDTPKLAARNSVIPGNNKLRQFTSLRAGLRVLSKSSVDYVIKVRTDQRIDLLSAAECLISVLNADQSKGRFIVPCFKKEMVLGVEDFYIGGRLGDLSIFCDVFLSGNGRDYAFSVHVDIFCKICRHWLGHTLNYPGWTYFPRDTWNPITVGQQAVAASAWREIFSTFPRAVWETATWRGEQLGVYPKNIYSDDYSRGIYHEISKICSSKTNYKSLLRRGFEDLLFTDWERYFSYFYDPVLTEIGRVLNRVSDLLVLLKRIKSSCLGLIS